MESSNQVENRGLAGAVGTDQAANLSRFNGEIIVVNNRSNDATPDIARSAGATVLDEPRQGYGFACMRGVTYLAARRNKPVNGGRR